MHEIARKAGVGKATVSLALRDDPKLRPETRLRIQKLAAKMGYRPNATVANLMAQLRASRTQRYKATLALLNGSPDPHALSATPVDRDSADGCIQRAQQLGYSVLTYWLHEPGRTAATLARELDAKNIRSIIVAALHDRGGLPEDFEVISGRFACVSAEFRPIWPSFNYSSNDQFVTASQTVRRLWQFGYRKIGLVIGQEADSLADHRLSAGFFSSLASLQAACKMPTFPFSPASEAAFRRWYAKHQPDAIVTLHSEVRAWLAKLDADIPQEIGLAHLDRHVEMHDWSGMDQNHALIGAAAIDMLVGQLHRNEVGLPEFPKATFVQSNWVDGPTTKQLITRKRTQRPAAAAV